MATINDIAKLAGVSHGTVSNVLNRKGNVSSKKIRLVEEAARKVGYQIDEQARSLRKGATSTIAIVLPNISDQRFSQIYSGIINCLESYSYSAKLYVTGGKPYRELEIIQRIVAIRACAVIVVSCLENPDQYYKTPAMKDMKLLFLLRKGENSKIPYFNFDYEAAGEQAGRELLKRGYADVWYLGEQIEKDNHESFQKGLRFILKNGNIKLLLFGQEEEDLNIYRFMGEEESAKVIIASNDRLAQKVSNAFCCLKSGAAPFILSLSHLTSAPDTRFCNLMLNYKKLGFEGAQALTEDLTGNETLQSRIFAASEIKTFSYEKQKMIRHKLKLFTLKTPTTDALSYLLPNFTKRTGCEVEIHSFPLSEVYDRLNTVEKLDYDIIRTDVSTFPYIAPRLLKPLGEVEENLEGVFRKFLPNLKQNYSEIDGEIYALPFDISVQMLFYRKDLFNDSEQMRSYYEQTKSWLAIPEDFQEFNRIARFFTKEFREDSPTKYGASIASETESSMASEYLTRLLACDGLKYDEDGILNLETFEAEAALENLKELIPCSNKRGIKTWSDAIDLFIKGDIAMTMIYANHAARITYAQEVITTGNVGYAYVPGMKPLLGGGCLGIYKETENPQLAYEFIKWATGSEIAAELMMLGGISPNRTAYEHMDIMEHFPWLEQWEENVVRGTRKSIFTGNSILMNQNEIERNLGKYVIQACNGKIDNRECLRKASHMIKNQLKNKE
jgi:DNA-binding LacI/PurR family transcriptional regulator/ABC-type glycerol-3-phosphate transport system substrate-binding protein